MRLKNRPFSVLDCPNSGNGKSEPKQMERTEKEVENKEEMQINKSLSVLLLLFCPLNISLQEV